jgi:hypothetical protein
MDEHALRVTASVLAALDQHPRGQVSIADLQAAVTAAAGALDNSNAAVVALLERLDADLEMLRFTLSPDDQPTAVQRRAAALRQVLTQRR